jgi:hypothetical protein
VLGIDHPAPEASAELEQEVVEEEVVEVEKVEEAGSEAAGLPAEEERSPA